MVNENITFIEAKELITGKSFKSVLTNKVPNLNNNSFFPDLKQVNRVPPTWTKQ